MAATIMFRGIAAPVDRVGMIAAGCFERILPGAFVNGRPRRPVVLQFASHDAGAPRLATTADGSLRLFEDSPAGLTFEADIRLDNKSLSALLYALRQGATGCSVNFSKRQKATVPFRNGEQLDKVVAGEIDHIAVGVADPCYRETAIWRADIDVADQRVRDLAWAWGWNRLGEIRPHASGGATNRPAPGGLAADNPLVRQLAASRPAVRASLERAMAAAASSGRPIVVMHAALADPPHRNW